jgi:hypothetical protein
MQINWPIIIQIITIITTISAPLLQVVFANWYISSRNTQPNPKAETKRAAGLTRVKKFLLNWASPIVLFVVNVVGLRIDFKTLHPPLVVRDVFFVALHVTGLAVALLIVAVMLILNLIGRMLDVQGRMADNHSGALNMIDWLATEVDKKADSRRRSK